MKLISQLSILFFLLISTNYLFAQEVTKSINPKSVEPSKEVVASEEAKAVADSVQTNDSDVVFVFVEDVPEYKGGDEARIKYLQQTIHYPEKAKEKNMQGTVYITFVVEKDGSVSNIKVLRGVCESLDAEAVRVISSMPDWTPGRQRGKAVRVQYNMPIRFVLADDGTSKHLTKKEKKALKKKQKAEAKAKKKAAEGKK